MRQLTAYASYLDNLGAPLVGRARFCNMDKSPALVYGLDNGQTPSYVPIGSTVYTNSSGQLVPQVFLADHDYLIFFDKYIGGGTMSEDDDPESWQEMGSAVDRYNTVGITVEGGSMRQVSSIDALRALHAADGDTAEIVLLLGYNEPGDKPAICYIWDDQSTVADDGGSVIKVDDVAVGRWKLVECPRYLDVRHFGAFPSQISAQNLTQRYAVQKAAAYAHSNLCGVLFTGNSLAAYYDITNIDLYDVDCDEFAMVYAVRDDYTLPADTVKATISGVKNIRCGSLESTENQGMIMIYDKVLKTSYSPSYFVSLAPTFKLIIDSNFSSSKKTFNDIIVYCCVDISSDNSWIFNDCIVIDVAKTVTLGKYTLESGHNESPAYDMLTLLDGSGDDIFHVYGNVPTFMKQLRLNSGLQIDADNSWYNNGTAWLLNATFLNLISGLQINSSNNWKYDNDLSQWLLQASVISASSKITSPLIVGLLQGSFRPTVNTNYVLLTMTSSSTTGEASTSANLSLPDGCIGFIVASYETAGAYLKGTVNMADINRKVTIFIEGTFGASVYLPIDASNIMIPIMRLNDEVIVGMTRYMHTRRNPNDTDEGCYIRIVVEST